MEKLKDYIKTQQLTEAILSTEFTDEQIDSAEYFNFTELADGNFRLTIYDKSGDELGHMDSSDIDSLMAYGEETFDIEEDDLEYDVIYDTE